MGALVALQQMKPHCSTSQAIETEGERGSQGGEQGLQLGSGRRAMQPQLGQVHHQEHQHQRTAPGGPAAGQGGRGLQATIPPAALRACHSTPSLTVGSAAQQGQQGMEQQGGRQGQLQGRQPRLAVEHFSHLLEGRRIQQRQAHPSEMDHQKQH